MIMNTSRMTSMRKNHDPKHILGKSIIEKSNADLVIDLAESMIERRCGCTADISRDKLRLIFVFCKMMAVWCVKFA